MNFPVRCLETADWSAWDEYVQIDTRETLPRGRVVAAILSFYFCDRALPHYGVSDPAFNHVALTRALGPGLARLAP